MYSGVYLALFALACGATYVYVVQEEAVVFSSAIAGATWSLLAVTGGGVEVVTDSGVETMSLGAAQHLFLGLAVLSIIALIGSVMGYYPTDPEIHNNEFRA